LLSVQFRNYAKDIVQIANDNAVNTISVLEDLSIAITSGGLANNKTFPFVHIPHFAVRTEKKRQLAGAEYLAWAPLVHSSERAMWANFSLQNQGWLEEGAEMLGLYNYTVEPISPVIHTYNGTTSERSSNDSASSDSGFYAPIWEMIPLPLDASVVNRDLMSYDFLELAVLEVINHKQVYMSAIQDEHLVFKPSDHDLNNTQNARSYIVEPVFKTFSNTSDVVGFVVAKIPWDVYFQNSLPGGINGLLIDVEDTCSSSFTYSVNGADTAFLRDGGAHDREHSDLVITSRFGESINFATNGCIYTFSIYPTNTFKDRYMTNRPLVYTFVVMMVFVFTILVFTVYDWLVARRQNLVLDTARRTQRIVSSLFPKNVQKRILEEAQQEDGVNDRGRRRAGFNAKNQLSEFLGDNNRLEAREAKSKPIADLFPVSFLPHILTLTL
jgi:hypothetical protein